MGEWCERTDGAVKRGTLSKAVARSKEHDGLPRIQVDTIGALAEKVGFSPAWIAFGVGPALVDDETTETALRALIAQQRQEIERLAAEKDQLRERLEVSVSQQEKKIAEIRAEMLPRSSPSKHTARLPKKEATGGGVRISGKAAAAAGKRHPSRGGG